MIRTAGGAIRDRVDHDRAALWTLGVAVVGYVCLGLWLTRGATFTADELVYFAESDGIGPEALATPFGGHLTAVTRLLFEASVSLFGTSHLPLQIAVLVSAAAVAVLVFFLVRLRVGSAPALAAALILLFFGSVPETLQGNTTMWVQATAAGLVAFLALERRSAAGDVVACLALVAGVLSLEVGVAFAVGAAVWLMVDPERRGRVWVAVIPLAIYAAWWLWALKFDEDLTVLSNLMLAPNYAAESAAAALAAAAGLGLDLEGGLSASSLSSASAEWGRVLLVPFAIAVALALRRSRPEPAFFGVVAFLLVFWVAGALAYGPLRFPDATRYVYPVAVGLILLAATAFRGRRPTTPVLFGLAVLVVFSLAANLWLLRERGTFIRTSSDAVQARLAIVEQQAAIVPDGYTKATELPVRAGDYLGAVDRNGSLAYSPAELLAAPPVVRNLADRTLGEIAAPTLAPVERPPVCRFEAPPATSVEVPPGGAVLGSATGATVTLRRFGPTPTIELGALPAGKPAGLDLQADDSDQPWVASAGPGQQLQICTPGTNP